jgi:hypothetical protein
MIITYDKSTSSFTELPFLFFRLVFTLLINLISIAVLIYRIIFYNSKSY